MSTPNKLFLLSMEATDEAFAAFESMVDKPASDIKIAMIENATDTITDAAGWLPGFREPWIKKGYKIKLIDLRKFTGDEGKKKLSQELQKFDVIWIGGGNVYYLRWIFKASGADEIIPHLIARGKTYAGWSAGAVITGPSIKYFDKMGDDPADAPEQIFTGLHLMSEIIIPHTDHPDFIEGAKETSFALQQDGFSTIQMKDGDFLVVS